MRDKSSGYRIAGPGKEEGEKKSKNHPETNDNLMRRHGAGALN
jgi:hypothetical protein